MEAEQWLHFSPDDKLPYFFLNDVLFWEIGKYYRVKVSQMTQLSTQFFLEDILLWSYILEYAQGILLKEYTINFSPDKMN